MDKLKDLQLEIENSLNAVRQMRDLPPQLEGLRYLAPSEKDARVIFRYLDGRKVREDASSGYLSTGVEAVIQYDDRDEADRPDARDAQAAESIGERETVSAQDSETQLNQLLEALEAAERGLPFVSLKHFRDTILLGQGFEWATDFGRRAELLRSATEQSLVLTSQVPNPNNPLHPVTAIRINRSHPRFRSTRKVAPTPSRSRFRPAPMKGRPLSATVMEDRR